MIDLKTEAAVVATLAKQAASATALAPGEVYAVSLDDGIHIEDTDKYAPAPRFVEGSRVVNDAASFVRYIHKHGLPSTEVWADQPGNTVVGIIDAHLGADLPGGWQKHRVNLVLEKSKSWLAWEAFDGKLVEQLEFAEFIDVRATDVRTPNPTDLIELAQFFTAHRKLDFKSAERIRDGQTQLNYTEEISGKAGPNGDIAIPERLQLVLRPYIGGPVYYVWARFRYRLIGSQLLLGVLLERPQEILDAAFADIITEIRDGKKATDGSDATDTAPAVAPDPGHEGITQPIFYGKPSR